MSMTDPVADLLTRIRNASKAGFPSVAIPHSRMKEDVARALKDAGFIKGVEVVGEGTRKNVVVSLKYISNKERLIQKLVRISRPGRRVYVGYNDIKPIRGGLGVAVFSTPKGVVTDSDAKKLKVGGEWICSVW